MANPFDQFDAPKKTGNPFDQFDNAPELMAAHEPGTRAISPTWQRTVSDYARPALEGGAMAAGGIVGAAAGLPATPVASAALGVTGGALGYAGGKRAADLVDEALGLREPQTIPQAAATTVQDLGEGAMMEMGGQAILPGAAMIGRGVANTGKEVLGMVTGKGPEAIAQAVKGNSRFAAGMAGDVSSAEIVGSAKDALTGIKGARSTAYTEQLAKIPKKAPVSKDRVVGELSTVMREFNIKPRVSADGTTTYDFSRSSITDSAAQKRVIDMISDIKEWGKKPDDLTPMGMDLLKRRLQDYYTAAGPANANSISTRLNRAAKAAIVKEVPEYAKMVKDYEMASDFIHEAERALSLNDRAMMDTTLKKLLSTQRENFEFRRELLQKMEEVAGRSLSPEIAGMSMQQIIPGGLIAKLGVGGAVASGGLSPGVLAYAAVSSPRVAGEVLHRVVGIPRREVGALFASKQFQKFSAAVKLDTAKRVAKESAPRAAIMSQVEND